MGNCAHLESNSELITVVSLDNFEIKYAIGRGGFGKV